MSQIDPTHLRKGSRLKSFANDDDSDHGRPNISLRAKRQGHTRNDGEIDEDTTSTNIQSSSIGELYSRIISSDLSVSDASIEDLRRMFMKNLDREPEQLNSLNGYELLGTILASGRQEKTIVNILWIFTNAAICDPDVQSTILTSPSLSTIVQLTKDNRAEVSQMAWWALANVAHGIPSNGQYMIRAGLLSEIHTFLTNAISTKTVIEASSNKFRYTNIKFNEAIGCCLNCLTSLCACISVQDRQQLIPLVVNFLAYSDEQTVSAATTAVRSIVSDLPPLAECLVQQSIPFTPQSPPTDVIELIMSQISLFTASLLEDALNLNILNCFISRAHIIKETTQELIHRSPTGELRTARSLRKNQNQKIEAVIALLELLNLLSDNLHDQQMNFVNSGCPTRLIKEIFSLFQFRNPSFLKGMTFAEMNRVLECLRNHQTSPRTPIFTPIISYDLIQIPIPDDVIEAELNGDPSSEAQETIRQSTQELSGFITEFVQETLDFLTNLSFGSDDVSREIVYRSISDDFTGSKFMGFLKTCIEVLGDNIFVAIVTLLDTLIGQIDKDEVHDDLCRLILHSKIIEYIIQTCAIFDSDINTDVQLLRIMTQLLRTSQAEYQMSLNDGDVGPIGFRPDGSFHGNQFAYLLYRTTVIDKIENASLRMEKKIADQAAAFMLELREMEGYDALVSGRGLYNRAPYHSRRHVIQDDDDDLAIGFTAGSSDAFGVSMGVSSF
ncbi:hypothetical protein BLNAU_12687 [Blattamonas nauphoetae]|uniref:Uncharacterized protein n=1 Tax=Blattamonas nauphoetae TaxID=2049346 RepID=A0ABQ9XMJ1_9EUKA|nr:hypothetical protein BLNAU_12687 [Blattamonas nauphoetae]